MSAADITALITAVTALVTAIGTLVSHVNHLNWHAQGKQQPSGPFPPAPEVPPKP